MSNLIIDSVALAKQGDNRIGSVSPYVCLSVRLSVCLSVRHSTLYVKGQAVDQLLMYSLLYGP